tara:strand:- start:52 stop:1080 length:1029 start_codon:yes stop_codon:yes gene_type:complete
MGVRSLGNESSSFGYKFGTTGIEAVAPNVAPVPFTSSGGTKITDGSDTYHVFLYTGSPQSFTVTGAPGSLTAYLLVVGGGGSGGFSADGVSGGGGAGGIQYYTQYPITDGTTTVVVGNRGANPGTASDYTADGSINDGENTTFGSAIAYGGGGGAHEYPGIRNESGHNGGCAGGGSSYHYPGTGPGTATQPGAPLVSGAGGTNYGQAGGTGMNSNPGVGGGGGGTQDAGKDGGGSPAGAGGDGASFTNFRGPTLAPAIPGPNVPVIGPTGRFAGGGAGGPGGPGLRPGGAGGGGSSGPGTSASDGTDATGYGSGGSGTQFGSGNSNGSPAGSPGIVIVKYSS